MVVWNKNSHVIEKYSNFSAHIYVHLHGSLTFVYCFVLYLVVFNSLHGSPASWEFITSSDTRQGCRTIVVFEMFKPGKKHVAYKKYGVLLFLQVFLPIGSKN